VSGARYLSEFELHVLLAVRALGGDAYGGSVRREIEARSGRRVWIGPLYNALGKLDASFKMMGEKHGFDAVALQRYATVEKIEHVHHAGNSSGIVDGASAVLLGSKEAGAKHGLVPRARIVTSVSVGSEPCIMLTGPAIAARKALAKAGLTVADIDLFEINEAFASVVLLFQKELGLDPAKVNVNGGAIAYGHPLGATGGMLVGIVVDELERLGKKRALVTLCVGAGMGTATIIERV
jgi:acetyl-CoA C-acetyltransferase